MPNKLSDITLHFRLNLNISGSANTTASKAEIICTYKWSKTIPLVAA